MYSKRITSKEMHYNVRSSLCEKMTLGGKTTTVLYPEFSKYCPDLFTDQHLLNHKSPLIGSISIAQIQSYQPFHLNNARIIPQNGKM